MLSLVYMAYCPIFDLTDTAVSTILYTRRSIRSGVVCPELAQLTNWGCAHDATQLSQHPKKHLGAWHVRYDACQPPYLQKGHTKAHRNRVLHTQYVCLEVMVRATSNVVLATCLEF